MYFRKRLFGFYKQNAFAFYLGSTWFVLINSSFLFCVKYFKNIENRHPYISDAIEILKLHENYSDDKDNIKVISKKGNIDSSNKRAKCELTILYNGEKVYLDINAVKIKKKQRKKKEESVDGNSDERNNEEEEEEDGDDDNDDEEEQEEEEENLDISSYIENPYLIKKELRSFFSSIKQFIESFISGDAKHEIIKNKTMSAGDPNEIGNETKENDTKAKTVRDRKNEILQILNRGNKWRINNILLVKKKKMTNPKDTLSTKPNGFVFDFLSKSVNHWYEIQSIYGNPRENSYYYKYEKKKEFNKIQTNIISVLFVAFLSSFILGVRRIITYKNAYSSINFVKRFVYNNNQLHRLLQNDQIQILSISGQHQKSYVNSKVFLQAKEKQGVVHITATKNENDKDFSLLHAKVVFDNQTVELR